MPPLLPRRNRTGRPTSRSRYSDDLGTWFVHFLTQLGLINEYRLTSRQG